MGFELTLHLHSAAAPLALDELFWRVATPGSASYQDFFESPAAAAPLFGGSPSSVREAKEWLQSLNGSNIHVSAMRDCVTASFASMPTMDRHVWSARGLPLWPPPRGVELVTRREPRPPPPRRTRPSPPPSEAKALLGPYDIASVKRAYKLPADLAATNADTLQMVWGPGTFGFSPSDLRDFAKRECPGLNVDKVHFDTAHHGSPGGDNWGEGTLDTRMISAFGMNVSTLVSNTNTSTSTEEGDGFGLALLDFLSGLASRETVPQVLSISLGSLSAASCELLCSKAADTGEVTLAECQAYLQQQRQVCMFTSKPQVGRINHALMALGLRGVTVFGSSGDGGSHWSFGRFRGFGKVARTLNKVGCRYQFPVFPTTSPYITSVGGTDWQGFDPVTPQMWSGSGGGFSWRACPALERPVEATSSRLASLHMCPRALQAPHRLAASPSSRLATAEFRAPAHQQATVKAYLQAASASLPPSDSFNASGRAYPDLAALAEDGTSQSSPITAGIFSLLSDARLTAGLKPLGPLGPRLYHVASAFPGAAFQDVTKGNTKTTCDNGFPATRGWDAATGWGRPVWPGLLKYFGSDEALLRSLRAKDGVVVEEEHVHEA